MREWLGQHFFRIGIVALVVDVLSRFYFQIGMTWLTNRGAAAGWTFGQLEKLAQISVALDITASILWWLFILGFASRVLAELTRAK